MTISFDGNFGEYLQAFIEQKRSLGFSYEDSCRLLSQFNKFCTTNFPKETILTKELCNAWAIRGDEETTTSFRARLTPVREFARYLNRIGMNAYVLPNNFAKKPQRPIPYVYSEEEIASLWSVLDCVKPQKQSPLRHIVIPAIFRVLYCCGLRPAEARKLRVEDVDLSNGKISIRESKKHADRIVMMADDLIGYCGEYDNHIRNVLPKREFFFPKSDGSMYSKTWFELNFRQMREKTEIAQFDVKKPRLYDFRHTFATHRLYQWIREGKDLSAMLPYLSAYMGHVRLSDTYYYIHFVPGQLVEMSGLDFSKYESLLPEVEADE
jgi:integrase